MFTAVIVLVTKAKFFKRIFCIFSTFETGYYTLCTGTKNVLNSLSEIFWQHLNILELLMEKIPFHEFKLICYIVKVTWV